MTLGDDLADFLAARVGARPFVLGDLRACLPALVFLAPDPVFDLPALAIVCLAQRFTAFHYQLRSLCASPAESVKEIGKTGIILASSGDGRGGEIHGVVRRQAPRRHSARSTTNCRAPAGTSV
jgi:hypothetical protein